MPFLAVITAMHALEAHKGGLTDQYWLLILANGQFMDMEEGVIEAFFIPHAHAQQHTAPRLLYCQR